MTKQQKHRRNVSEFAALIASPADLASPVTLPGNGRLAVSSDVGGTVSVNAARVGFTSPALAADQIHRGPTWFERTTPITVTGSGNVDLFLVDRDRLHLIGQGAL